MFIEYIERLRTRPLAERRRVAFVTALAMTAGIGLIWSFSLPARVGSLTLDLGTFKEGAEEAGLEAAVSEGEKGLQQFINSQETWKGAIPKITEGLAQLGATSTATGSAAVASSTSGATSSAPFATSSAARPVMIATSSSMGN